MEPPSRRRLLQPRPLTSFLSFLFLSLSFSFFLFLPRAWGGGRRGRRSKPSTSSHIKTEIFNIREEKLLASLRSF